MILKFVVDGIWSLVNQALNGNYDLLENNGFSSPHTEIMNQQNKGIEISTRQDRFRVENTLVTTNTVTAIIDYSNNHILLAFDGYTDFISLIATITEKQRD